MKGQMEHIETKKIRTNLFTFPQKYKNYRRIIVIMTIDNVGNTTASIKSKSGNDFQQLKVSAGSAAWARFYEDDFSFMLNQAEPCRLLFDIVTYKHNAVKKTEMKILNDNDYTAAEIDTSIQLSHLTFDNNLDEVQILPTNEQHELDISYTAYGELE